VGTSIVACSDMRAPRCSSYASMAEMTPKVTLDDSGAAFSASSRAYWTSYAFLRFPGAAMTPSSSQMCTSTMASARSLSPGRPASRSARYVSSTNAVSSSRKAPCGVGPLSPRILETVSVTFTALRPSEPYHASGNVSASPSRTPHSSASSAVRATVPGAMSPTSYPSLCLAPGELLDRPMSEAYRRSVSLDDGTSNTSYTSLSILSTPSTWRTLSIVCAYVPGATYAYA